MKAASCRLRQGRGARAARRAGVRADPHPPRLRGDLRARSAPRSPPATLRPGDKLPADASWRCSSASAARNALREALRSLEIAGIVRLQKGAKGGAFIQSGDANRMNERRARHAEPAARSRSPS